VESVWEATQLADTLSQRLGVSIQDLPDHSAAATLSAMPPGVGGLAWALVPHGDGAGGGGGHVLMPSVLAKVADGTAPLTGRYHGDDGEVGPGGGTAVWNGRGNAYASNNDKEEEGDLPDVHAVVPCAIDAAGCEAGFKEDMVRLEAEEEQWNATSGRRKDASGVKSLLMGSSVAGGGGGGSIASSTASRPRDGGEVDDGASDAGLSSDGDSGSGTGGGSRGGSVHLSDSDVASDIIAPSDSDSDVPRHSKKKGKAAAAKGGVPRRPKSGAPVDRSRYDLGEIGGIGGGTGMEHPRDDPAVVEAGIMSFNHTCHICHHPKGWGFVCPVFAAARLRGGKCRNAHGLCARCVEVQTGLPFHAIRTGAAKYFCILCDDVCTCAACMRKRGSTKLDPLVVRQAETVRSNQVRWASFARLPLPPSPPSKLNPGDGCAAPVAAPQPPAAVRAGSMVRQRSRASAVSGGGGGGGGGPAPIAGDGVVFTTSLLTFSPATVPALTRMDAVLAGRQPALPIVLRGGAWKVQAQRIPASPPDLAAVGEAHGALALGAASRPSLAVIAPPPPQADGPLGVQTAGGGEAAALPQPPAPLATLPRATLQDMSALFRRCEGIPMPVCRGMQLELCAVATSEELEAYGMWLPPACCSAAAFNPVLSGQPKVRRKYVLTPRAAALQLWLPRAFDDWDFMSTGLHLPLHPGSTELSPLEHRLDGRRPLRALYWLLPPLAHPESIHASQQLPLRMVSAASLPPRDASALVAGGWAAAAAHPAVAALWPALPPAACPPGKCRLCGRDETMSEGHCLVTGVHPFVPVDTSGALLLICHEVSAVMAPSPFPFACRCMSSGFVSLWSRTPRPTLVR